MYDQNSQYDNSDFAEQNQSQETNEQVEEQNEPATPPTYTYVFSSGNTAQSGTSAFAPPPQKKNGFPWGKMIIAIVLCVSLSFAAGFGGTQFAFAMYGVTGDQTETQQNSNVIDPPNEDSLYHEDPQALISQDQSDPSIYGSAGDEVFSISQVVRKVEASVVVIDATVLGGKSSGSGVIISDQGYILTCNHVVENATSVTVTLSSGTQYSAAFVGGDTSSDLAMLKIEPQENEPLTYAEHGKSANLVVGEMVVAIGNPLGFLGGTVTHGIISSTERNITMSDGTTMTLLQTDVAINSGNSGGGLFNLDGELVGIVNAKYESKEGLAFAIPIDSALPIEQDLIKYGYVRGIVDHGMETLYISEAELYIYHYRFGITTAGVYVVNSKICTELQNKDRIVSVNGVTITTQDQFDSEIQKYKVGDVLTIVASRDGKNFTVTLTLQEYVPDNISNELK